MIGMAAEPTEPHQRSFCCIHCKLKGNLHKILHFLVDGIKY